MDTFTPVLITWIIPCSWPILCIVALTIALRWARLHTIVRVLPRDVPTDENRRAFWVRFWKTEPAKMRETWVVKSYLYTGLAFMIGGILVAFFCWVLPRMG